MQQSPDFEKHLQSERQLSASTRSVAELQAVALAGTCPSCWWRKHAGYNLGTPLVPCSSTHLECACRGWIASLRVLDLQQGDFHAQGRTSVILKTRWQLSLLRIHKTPSFGYGARSDFYWDSAPHMLPLLTFSSCLWSGLWMFWGQIFSAFSAQRCRLESHLNARCAPQCKQHLAPSWQQAGNAMLQHK